jgi:2'-5' RNA ligase
VSLEPKAEVGDAAHVRLFIAISVPDVVRAALRQAQGELKALLPGGGVAWTRPESLHLTLRFLGNVDSTRMPELSQRFNRALAGFGGLDLICARLGCFPDLRFPRVVWAGVHDAAERLLLLHRKLEEAVRDFAEKPSEACFVGHITLARLKQINRREAGLLARFLERGGKRGFGDWRTDAVILFRNQLSPIGATHEVLRRATLQ